MGAMWSGDRGGNGNQKVAKKQKEEKSPISRDKVHCQQKSEHLVRCSFQLDSVQYSQMQRSGKLSADAGSSMVYIGIALAVLVLIVLIAAFAFIWHRMNRGQSGAGGAFASGRRSGMKSHAHSASGKKASKKSLHSKSKKSNKSKKSKKSRKSGKSGKKK